MAIKYLKGEELMKEIDSGIVVVNYFAQWCGPCKMLGPILEELSEKTKVIKIDIDQNKEFVQKQKIQGVPRTFFYKDGELKGEHFGFAPIEVFQNKIYSL